MSIVEPPYQFVVYISNYASFYNVALLKLWHTLHMLSPLQANNQNNPEKQEDVGIRFKGSDWLARLSLTIG